jgi:hypothetical protein
MKNIKGNTMKTFITTFALLLMFAVGCTDQTSITSPEQPVQTQEPNWIALPQPSGMQVNEEVSSSKVIDGSKGGHISLNSNFYYGRVILKSDLEFPSASFSGSVNFTVTHDAATCVSTFGTSFVFNQDLIFNISYTGLNLNGINPSRVKFAYIAADGSVQYAVNDGIIVDLVTGKLEVINAKVPHFSRYGFVN